MARFLRTQPKTYRFNANNFYIYYNIVAGSLIKTKKGLAWASVKTFKGLVSSSAKSDKGLTNI